MNSPLIRRKRPTLVQQIGVGVLLLCILLFAGTLRFSGQNWDDFSDMHPDERFLTQNLLPLVGGGLEFTPSETYPMQVIVVNPGSPLNSRVEIETVVNYGVGAMRGTLGAETAAWWLGAERTRVYDTPEAALAALQNSEVAALVVDNIAAQVFGSNVRSVEVISSEEVQRMRCRALNPATNGAGSYFDTDCSPLNPHNAGAGFYAYGTLPLFMAHFTNQFVYQQETAGSTLFDYQGTTLIWRFLSAFFDCGTVLMIFLVGARLHHKGIGLLAALLYAAAPLAIQKSHFGTVNAITGFFVIVALWAAVGVQDGRDVRRWLHFAIFGGALGAAMAGRINTLPLAGVVVLAAMANAAPMLDVRLPWRERQNLFVQNLIGLGIAGFTTLLIFRLGNPYAFRGPTFFNVLPIDPSWLKDMGSAAYGVSGNADYAPNWQWMGRASYLFPLKDMILWGMGVAAGVMAWFGWAWAGYQLVRGKLFGTRHLLLFVWVLVYFGYMGRQWVMTMRYYLPLYSALVLLAAWAVFELIRQARLNGRDIPLTRCVAGGFGLFFGAIPVYTLTSGAVVSPTIIAAALISIFLLALAFVPRIPQRAVLLGGFVTVFTVLWGVMFSHIYRDGLTRVQASRWVWENVAGDFALKVEGAPEGTPLVNIAIPNSPMLDSITTPTLLQQGASRLGENLPYVQEFTVPADGILRQVYIPHLGDVNDDADAETLSISIARQGDTVPLAVGIMTQDFPRDQHVLGDAYLVNLDAEIPVKQGERYLFKAESLAGTLVTGSVVITEGDWDDRITSIGICQLPDNLTLKDNPPSGLASYNNCNAYVAWTALVNSYDLFMAYEDVEVKRQSLIDGLNTGDYIAITSNRFYDTEPRNRLRWPLTAFYYEQLFAGNLGYDLAVTFDESYQLGVFSVSDQHLPIYNSPRWLNEFEADEAFHVYDHPAVFIFKKRDDYDPQKVAFLLNSVPILRTNELALDSGRPFGAQLAGVATWSSLQASEAPTALMLTTERAATQQNGGTWSERFNSTSLLNTNQVVGGMAWWLTIVLFGWAAFPLLFVAFPMLADRGYTFGKLVGLFLVAWLAWVISTLQVPLWSQGGVLLCLLIVAGVSAAVAYWQRVALRDYVREHWRRLLAIEVLTLILFIAFIGVRLTNPDLWHIAKGGEKPMDFAMLNAVLRSTIFPPYDAWHSGGYINYYYWGYVLVGSPVLLLQIVPSFAYNLILPTLFALAGMGAFAVAFNIAQAWQELPTSRFWRKFGEVRPLGNAWVAGIAALVLCVVLGNLDTVRVVGNGIAQLGGYTLPLGIEDYLRQQYKEQNGVDPSGVAETQIIERAAYPSLFDRLAYEFNNSASLIQGLASGLGQALGGATLPIGSDRWYWAPTRVIAEIPDVGGNAINEMPYFTFLYGDLHAHMINMPVLLFVMLFVFHELLQAGQDRRTWFAFMVALCLGALFVGMTKAINTWDYPAFLILCVLGLGYAWWLRWQDTFRELDKFLLYGVILAGAAVGLFGVTHLLPDNMKMLLRLSGAAGIGLMGLFIVLGTFQRRAVVHLVAWIGGFLILAAIFAQPYTTWFAATYSQVNPWVDAKTPLWAYLDIHGVFIFLLVSLLLWDTARWLRTIRVKALRGQMVWGVLGFVAVLLVLLSAVVGALASYQVALVTVPLILWIGVLFFRPQQARVFQFVLVLAGLALALTLGVEIVVLGGDIGRQNTVFKFYMQAWLLFSVVGGVAFAYLVQASDEWSNKLRVLWYAPMMLLFVIASMYPIMATRARSLDRMSFDVPLTLNGLDWMPYATYPVLDTAEYVPLKGDYEMIRWLQENVQGSPVIIEGREAYSEYRWNARIAINTGLPTVLGWNFHQRQQRTFAPLPEFVQQREYNIKYFYNTASTAEAVRILYHYGVQYVVFGELERNVTLPEGVAKFEVMESLGLITRVFNQENSSIYQVHLDAVEAYLFQQEGSIR